MRCFLILIAVSLFSCVSSKKNCYKMVSVYNDTDYHSSFYNFENLKSSKKITIYDDSNTYKVGDIIYITDNHKK